MTTSEEMRDPGERPRWTPEDPLLFYA